MREALIASVDEAWISGAAHLGILLGPRVSPSKLEELLANKCVMCHTDPEEQKRLWILRKVLNDMNPVESMELLKKQLKQTQSNAEFFMSMKTDSYDF